MDELPKGLLDELTDYNHREIQLIIGSKIIYQDDAVGGLFLYDKDVNPCIITTISNSSSHARDTFYHELTHFIAEYISDNLDDESSEDYASKWISCNPTNFMYKEHYELLSELIGENSLSQSDIQYDDYVKNENISMDNTYFVSEYSVTNQEEDRAELVSYVSNFRNYKEFIEFSKYNKLMEKLIFMDEYYKENFDSIDEQNCFQWQKWLYKFNQEQNN